jgi:hypothetical protein
VFIARNKPATGLIRLKKNTVAVPKNAEIIRKKMAYARTHNSVDHLRENKGNQCEEVISRVLTRLRILTYKIEGVQ